MTSYETDHVVSAHRSLAAHLGSVPFSPGHAALSSITPSWRVNGLDHGDNHPHGITFNYVETRVKAWRYQEDAEHLGVRMVTH